MITGTIPWAGDKSQEQLINTLSGTWLDLPTISIDMKKIFNKIFVVDATKRVSMQELMMEPAVLSSVVVSKTRTKSLLRRISGAMFPVK